MKNSSFSHHFLLLVISNSYSCLWCEVPSFYIVAKQGVDHSYNLCAFCYIVLCWVLVYTSYTSTHMYFASCWWLVVIFLSINESYHYKLKKKKLTSSISILITSRNFFLLLSKWCYAFNFVQFGLVSLLGLLIDFLTCSVCFILEILFRRILFTCFLKPRTQSLCKETLV